MKSKKNRNDFVLILVLLAVILISFLVVRLQRQKDAFTVDVSVNGTTVATYRLDEEIDTWIDGYQGGQNHLVIQDGCARIEEADCPDKLCVKQGTVSESGESLVCLPNRVVVAVFCLFYSTNLIDFKQLFLTQRCPIQHFQII